MKIIMLLLFISYQSMAGSNLDLGGAKKITNQQKKLPYAQLAIKKIAEFFKENSYNSSYSAKDLHRTMSIAALSDSVVISEKNNLLIFSQVSTEYGSYPEGTRLSLKIHTNDGFSKIDSMDVHIAYPTPKLTERMNSPEDGFEEEDFHYE